jgi:hypothetical protein
MRWHLRHRDPVATVPDWDGPHDTMRVLLEHPDPGIRSIVERDLTAQGYEVLTCAGPGAIGEPGTPCPVLRQETCPAVAGADVVVSGLPLHDARARLIVHRISRDDPDRPLIVEAPNQLIERYGHEAIEHHLFPLRMAPLSRMLHDVASGRATGRGDAPDD